MWTISIFLLTINLYDLSLFFDYSQSHKSINYKIRCENDYIYSIIVLILTTFKPVACVIFDLIIDSEKKM